MMNWAQKTFDKIIKAAQSKDVGKTLAVTGSIGWGLSCLAYTGALVFNKEIPSDQKKFLVPQELADGVINVGLFWIFTNEFNKKANKLVNEGKILPKALKDRVLEIRKMNSGNIPPLETFEKHLEKSNDIGKFMEFKRSFPALVSITGSIIAANIVTPLVRNIVASKFQQTHVHHDIPLTQEKRVFSQQQRPTNIVKPLPVNSYSNGQMKI
ncbi:MAG: hypothetical protein WCF95_05125 [bacterium]